jgi:DNA-binding NarL/FixJ family response regulator
MKILLVDDHKLIRDAIFSYLENDADFNVVGQVSNGQEAIDFLAGNNVDVIMMDINMPVMDGVAGTEIITKKWPDVKVLALTMMSDNQHIKQMMNAGALGYILKNCTEEEVKEALNTVNAGDTYYSTEVTETVMASMMKRKPMKTSHMVVDIPLTEREKEVLRLIIKEYSNQEIADELFISPRTVDAHKRNLLEKTGSKNVAGLVLYAIDKQLFEDL